MAARCLCMINSKLLLVIITFIDDFGLPDYRGFFVVVVIVFFCSTRFFLAMLKNSEISEMKVVSIFWCNYSTPAIQNRIIKTAVYNDLCGKLGLPWHAAHIVHTVSDIRVVIFSLNITMHPVQPWLKKTWLKNQISQWPHNSQVPNISCQKWWI